MLIHLAPNPFCWRGLSYQLRVCDGLTRDARLDQPVKEFAFPETSVEAVADFIQITFQMFVRDATMGASYHSLGVGY